MDQKHLENTKRVAKNTGLLYFRTIVMLLISLFTSRVVLEALGVENFGINNVVAGVVGMFSIISGSLSSSISRFLTYALGENNKDKLRRIFSMSVNIQIFLGVVIILLAELGGIWFINNKLNIPPDRLIAAHWVFQCSLFSFFVSLINVPYNACLIAHERMGVFAYMTILDVVIKLLVAYTIFVTPFDSLITLAVLNLFVAILMRVIYGLYCIKHFDECRYEWSKFDKNLAKEMTGFAWWSFFGNTAWMFNTQGVNILINVFFGVVYNAARGVAAQVEGAVMGFVNNFTTALNPQITKSYAAKDIDYLFALICRGTKFTYFLTLFFAIPLWFEAQTVLSIWLVEVPIDSAIFLKLSLICSIITTAGSPMLTAIMANGDIKNYEIVVTVIGCLVFPFTYLSYKLGASILSTYFIYMVIYSILIWVKVDFLKRMFGFPVNMFISKVLKPSILVTILSFVLPACLTYVMSEGLMRLLIMVPLTLLSTFACVYIVGLSQGERHYISTKVRTKLGFV